MWQSVMTDFYHVTKQSLSCNTLVSHTGTDKLQKGMLIMAKTWIDVDTGEIIENVVSYRT